MAYAPFTQTLRVYKGMTYAYQQNFTENGSDLDLTTIDDIEVRLFNSNGEIFSHSVSGGELTISGSNNESLAGTASDTTMDIAKRSYYQETIFKRSDGTQDVYVAFLIEIIDAEDQQNQTAHEWNITIDTDAETVSGEQLTGLTALALQYKDDAETAKTGAETAESNAQDSANDAEKQAQNTTSFTDSDGNNFSKGAQGYANDASSSASNAATSESNAATSESNAATSASNAADDADDAELQAQSTTSFTDSDGNNFDNGAKGYAQSILLPISNQTEDKIPAALDGIAYEQVSDNSTKAVRFRDIASLINAAVDDTIPTINLTAVNDVSDYSLVSLTRTTVKKYFGSGRVMQESSSGSLVASYDVVTGKRRGWNVEEAGTNEISDSRDLTTGNWVAETSAPSVARDAVGIGGVANTACTLTDNNTSQLSSLQQSITIPDDSNTHHMYVFIQKEDDESVFPEVVLTFLGGTTTLAQVVQINKKTGASTFRAVNDGSFDVEDWGDYWKVNISLANNGTGNTTLYTRLRPAISDTFGTYDETVTGASIFDQVQVELDTTFPSSPIVTSGGSGTRNADQVTISDVSNIGTSQDTFYVDFTTGYDAGVLFDLHSDGSNRIYLERNSSNEIHFIIDDGGVTQADLNLGTVADHTSAKAAVAYRGDDIAGSLDGGTVQTDTDATIPSFSTLHIGRDYNDANYLNGYVNSLRSYGIKLTDTQLQSLTS